MDETMWHILRVKPGHEADVALGCGVYSYVPHKTISYYNRRKRAQVSRRVVMLPGYVFTRVRSPRDVRISPRKETYGFMRNGDGSYAILRDRAFDALRLIEAEFAAKPISKGEEKPWCPSKGDKIELSFGGNSTKAVVAEIRGDKLLADIIGTAIRVSTDVVGVRPAACL